MNTFRTMAGMIRHRCLELKFESCLEGVVLLHNCTPGDGHECDNPKDCECDNYDNDKFIVIAEQNLM